MKVFKLLLSLFAATAFAAVFYPVYDGITLRGGSTILTPIRGYFNFGIKSDSTIVVKNYLGNESVLAVAGMIDDHYLTGGAQISNANLANMSASTFKCRLSSTGVPTDCTPTQVGNTLPQGGSVVVTGNIIDWSMMPGVGGYFYKKITSNTVLTFSNVNAGPFVNVVIENGGAFTVTWPTTKWVGSTVQPVATSGAGKLDLWSFTNLSGLSFLGNVLQDFGKP